MSPTKSYERISSPVISLSYCTPVIQHRVEDHCTVDHTTASTTNTIVALPAYNSPKVPPCKVCDGKGGGLHYGVITCEPCKGFFSRCNAGRKKLKCAGLEQGRCAVSVHNPSKKRMCSACRYRKCIAVGMSRHGVKIGRTSYMQVTAAIEEVKRLELQQRIKNDGTLVTQEQHLLHMDQIVHKLTHVHLNYRPNNNCTALHNLDVERMYIEQKVIDQQLFGERKYVGRLEYNEIYQKTTLDVDGRKAQMSRLIPMMARETQQIYNFVRAIPGFRTLSRNDQVTLIRDGILEASSFLYFYLYNTEHGIYVHPADPSIVIDIRTMTGYSDGPSNELYDELLHIAADIQRLELSDEERVTAAALALMSADCELSVIGYKIASASAEYLSEVLYNLINKNHDSDQHVYTKIILFLTRGRSRIKELMQHLNNFFCDNIELGMPEETLELFVRH